jgi:imidazolonepropionase-like amidohydrolase
VEDIGAGVALRGRVWAGPGQEWERGAIVVDADGMVAAVGAVEDVVVPDGMPVLDAAWAGPGLVDAHVHLAFADPIEVLRHGVVAVRDLGAPPRDAAGYRQLRAPRVDIAGPLITAPGGYPSRTWGRAGFAAFIDDEEQASRLVRGLAQTVDVIKLALEPAGDAPTPSPELCRVVVDVAHEEGKGVVAHAMSTDMVVRALDAGVDELAHMPTQALPAELIERLAGSAPVVSALVTGSADDPAVLFNARRLAEAGGTIRYGTDLGNVATRPGADPRELRLLAEEVGLGAEGTLAIATEPVRPGQPAAVVALDADPRTTPSAWRKPKLVVVGSALLRAAA